MKRRNFFRQFFGALGIAAAGPSVGKARKWVLVQDSPVAGFQFHQGEAVWASLNVGMPLTLCREPNNPHDPSAVAVCFRDDKVGYIPAAENTAIAQMLDRGEKLAADISKLTESNDPWERIQITISLA